MIDMELYDALDTATDKLSALLEKNEWSMEIDKNEYPIVFRFRKGVGAFTREWNPETTPQIEFCFRNTTYVSCVPEQYKVDEKFLNKLKNLCKEICRLYLMAQFSRKDTRFDNAFKELWTTCKGDRVGILKGTYRP
ncbi:MAG: hypothetical protein ACOX6U_09130 [Oscillospiraceae bacterium]|jgi:hypothetical protein